MRLVVTGGAGYLGSEVARQAVERGDDVVVTRLNREAPHGRPLRLDLADAAAVDAVFADVSPEVVVHTAYRQADERLEEDVLEATANVARASDAVGARLVHLSTDLVFDGERAPPARYDEDDEPRPVSAYGRAKHETERVVLEYERALVVRTSLLYGKPSGPQERLARRDDVAFYTDEIRSPIHVRDLAAALLELASRTDVTGVLHVAGPDAVSRLELARLLAPDHRQRGAPSPPDRARARNVALDSSRAAALLRTRIRSLAESLHSLHS
jgi:dTDP-4-dehydrorhamnose reductase